MIGMFICCVNIENIEFLPISNEKINTFYWGNMLEIQVLTRESPKFIYKSGFHRAFALSPSNTLQAFTE